MARAIDDIEAIFGRGSGREEAAMKFGVIMLVLVAVAGCSRESVPGIPTAPAAPVAAPAPPAPPTGSALLWVMVISETGSCIEGATIQIVRAEGAGEPIPQRTPCGAWDDDGGLLLTDLRPDVDLTLRGAARGYARREMSFRPFPMPGSYRAVFITLSKAQ
jgi:hypothetical protein